MRLIELLHGIGGKLGILESVALSDEGQTVAIRTRTVTLRELSIEVKSVAAGAFANLPDEIMDFDKIFEAAGVALPPKGWTVDKLGQLAGSGRYKDASKLEIQKSILEILSSEGVPAEEIIKDAIARDNALDSFEALTEEKIHGRAEACSKRELEIELQIKRLQEEASALKDSRSAEEKKWLEWKRKKRARERAMALAISYVIDRPVITTDDDK